VERSGQLGLHPAELVVDLGDAILLRPRLEHAQPQDPRGKGLDHADDELQRREHARVLGRDLRHRRQLLVADRERALILALHRRVRRACQVVAQPLDRGLRRLRGPAEEIPAQLVGVANQLRRLPAHVLERGDGGAQMLAHRLGRLLHVPLDLLVALAQSARDQHQRRVDEAPFGGQLPPHLGLGLGDQATIAHAGGVACDEERIQPAAGEHQPHVAEEQAGRER
jgi:hypothetical protein